MVKKTNENAIVMENIQKYFNGLCVLKNFNVSIKKGSIHALLGENGAGKTTLMNILYGLYKADSGTIFINGNKVNIKNSNTAIKLGIGMVHQHFMLVQPFTVLQNIILGKEPTNRFGILNFHKIRAEIQHLSQKYGLEVDLNEKVENISVGMQQRVEILKTLYRGAEILILDEPTAVLATHEVEKLIDILHNLTEDGKTVIIITHKIKEIKKVAKYCTVIRKGQNVDTVNVDEVTENELANMMVGRSVSLNVEKTVAQPKKEIFSIESLTVKDSKGLNKVDGLSLSVKQGEIMGIAGIDGNGQKELVDAITNLARVESGKIKINGEEIQNTSIKNVINHKISTIPEDRHKMGLILDFTVAENAVLTKYSKKPFHHNGVVNFNKVDEFADAVIKNFDVRPVDCKKFPVRSLSGGNQQKIIIGREISNNPDLLIAVQPTRGLDVGAIEYVHKSLINFRDSGRAVLLISLDLDEIMDVSDRIAVIYEGKIVDVIDAKDADENKISLLMAGGK